jgi:hypothetical protein
MPTSARWPAPAQALYFLAWLTILALLVVAAVRVFALWRAWRRGELPPFGTPGAGRPFTAIGRVFGLMALLSFLARVPGQRYTR